MISILEVNSVLIFIGIIAGIGIVGMMSIGIMSLYFGKTKIQNERNLETFMVGVEKGVSNIEYNPNNAIEAFGARVGRHADKVIKKRGSK